MEKRALILGDYNTAGNGWTLAALALTDPDYQARFQEVIGRDGPLDLSTALTGGVPHYGGRTLTATLELSEGTRTERQARIGKMVNALDGFRMDIRHPDYPAHYLTGRVQVKVDFNNMAYASVLVTATCDPWLYSAVERAYTLTDTGEEEKALVLTNAGRRIATPTIVLTETPGQGGAVLHLTYAGTTWVMGTGMDSSVTRIFPQLQLRPGDTLITYKATGGTARISYREAALR